MGKFLAIVLNLHKRSLVLQCLIEKRLVFNDIIEIPCFFTGLKDKFGTSMPYRKGVGVSLILW